MWSGIAVGYTLIHVKYIEIQLDALQYNMILLNTDKYMSQVSSP